MTSPLRAPFARCLVPAALLALALVGCGDPSSGPSEEAATATAPAGASPPGAATGDPVSDGPGGPGGGQAATGAAASETSGAPPGHDVAPYDDTAERDAAGSFGASQGLTGSLEAVVEGPRPGTTGERSVRAAPGTPVQVFTLTLTNTGSAPVDAVPWSFPVAVVGGEPATPVFDESLGVRMETFPTIAPGESASLDVAFGAAHDAGLAVRVFDNTTPDHYVEFTD